MTLLIAIMIMVGLDMSYFWLFLIIPVWFYHVGANTINEVD